MLAGRIMMLIEALFICFAGFLQTQINMNTSQTEKNSEQPSAGYCVVKLKAGTESTVQMIAKK